MNYERVYIRKSKKSSGGKLKTYDTIDDFKIYCKDIPFKLYSDVKDVYSNDWVDEDGIEEYTPEDYGLKFKSYSIDVEWAYKGTKGSANTYIKKFLNYLSGKDGSGVMMSMYCTWTKIGRQNVRLEKIGDTATFLRDTDNGDIVIFKTTFKVGDPVTDITLTYNHIIEDGGVIDGGAIDGGVIENNTTNQTTEEVEAGQDSI